MQNPSSPSPLGVTPQTYTIESEAGHFVFDFIQHHDTMSMHELRLNRLTYFYEPGDSYLYDALEGGESHYLGEVFSVYEN